MKRRSLHTVRFVSYALFAAALLSILIGQISKVMAFPIAGVVFAFAGLIWNLIFYRCPHCRGYLGRNFPDGYCPHCGRKLEDTPGD